MHRNFVLRARVAPIVAAMFAAGCVVAASGSMVRIGRWRSDRVDQAKAFAQADAFVARRIENVTQGFVTYRPVDAVAPSGDAASAQSSPISPRGAR